MQGRKSLEEMLIEDAAKEGEPVSKSNRRFAAFKTYWPEIKEGYYHKGWSYTYIWSVMVRRGIIDFSYPTFIHYKDKMLTRERQAAREKAAAEKASEPENDGPTHEKQRPQPRQPQGGGNNVIPTFGEAVPPRSPKRF